MHQPSHDPSKDWTPEQQRRLARALERVEGVVDALGHPLDKGIIQAVAMLNELGITTAASCEGHANWATGGPYIDIVSPQYRKMKNESRAMGDAPSQVEAQARLRVAMKLANAIEGKKLLPVLDEFYKNRDTSYERRIGLIFFGEGITRLESVGVAFLDAQPDPAVKLELLGHFQAEMKAFSDFLVAYEPGVAPLPNPRNTLASKQPQETCENPRALPRP